MNLVWNKCQADAWCPFMTVYVGKGDIADRIQAHRDETNISQYVPNIMFVTWAEVPADAQDGVESYLIKALKPLENKNDPTAVPTKVNTPWD